MAKMFPKASPQNTGSTRAEPDLYWRLSKNLSDEFTVIHSLPWLASVSKEIDGRSVPTGEIDFLILHRELGILAVEVKGGIFTHDRTEFVYKRTGQKIDPIRQVRRGTHALAQWLHESGAGSGRIGYCIFFPHSEMREAIPIALIDRTVNPPQSIVLDINALNDIGRSIQDVMIYWKKALGSWSLNEQQFQKLVDVILPSSDYTPCWETRIKNDIVTWLQLTPEQVACLKKIEKETRLVVTGFAGTGKSLLL
ncbi:MAG: NERD domain-containing protein, partial [Pseudanabaena sp.]